MSERQTTQIEWHKASELPDSDTTVLIALEAAEGFVHSPDCHNEYCALAGGPEDCDGVVEKNEPSELVWIGYHDGEVWYYSDAMAVEATVTHWAPMPEPPKE